MMFSQIAAKNLSVTHFPSRRVAKFIVSEVLNSSSSVEYTIQSVRSARIVFSSGHHGALPGSQIASTISRAADREVI